MEYRLNKIDTDVRQRINDTTKEGKVHGENGIYISRDIKEKQKDNPKEKDKNKPKFNFAKKIVVKAVKTENVDIDAFKDDNTESLQKGRFIDTKK